MKYKSFVPPYKSLQDDAWKALAEYASKLFQKAALTQSAIFPEPGFGKKLVEISGPVYTDRNECPCCKMYISHKDGRLMKHRYFNTELEIVQDCPGSGHLV
jgi:hypothetical protein